MKQKVENIQVKISGGGATGLSDTLNKMGDEGWEPWHMIERPDSVIVFLKRPREAAGLTISPELARRING